MVHRNSHFYLKNLTDKPIPYGGLDDQGIL